MKENERYYFEFDLDWDKLKYLEKKYNSVKPLLDEDLINFKDFLNRLQQIRN